MYQNSCIDLLEKFMKRDRKEQGTRIPVSLPEGDTRDVYNLCAPFAIGEKEYLLARVEERDSEDSQVLFFRWENSRWNADTSYPILQMQDPFTFTAEGIRIIGGVEIYPIPQNPSCLGYKTVFFKLEGNGAVRFAEGPELMKDIRLLEIEPGKILLLTRPQDGQSDQKWIGWKIISSLDELNIQTIQSASILRNQFAEGEWGGANEAHLLENGLIGVLAHAARFDEQGNRHYYSTVFAFCPEKGKFSSMEMIARRSNFEEGESKRPDLTDVVFSGGLVRKPDGKAELYCGVGDAESHVIEIDDPFLKWETLNEDGKNKLFE